MNKGQENIIYPLVSIVIPVYNEESYITSCIKSLMKQTYKNIEIICIDDGSIDKSSEIILTLKRIDTRLRLIQQDNRNAGNARNRGLREARGKYIMFLDADDIFAPELIERMVKKIENEKADIVMCSAYGMDQRNLKIYEMPEVGKKNNVFQNLNTFTSKDLAETVFQLSVTWAWNKMYLRDFIRDNNILFQSLITVNDLYFVCIAYIVAKKITVVNKKMICHRTNKEKSLFSIGTQNWKCIFLALYKLKEELIEKEIYEDFQKSYLNLAMESIVYYLILRFEKEEDFKKFYEYYKKKAEKEFDFLKHSRIFYYDMFAYEIIKLLYEKNEYEFLVSCINKLNQKVRDQIGIINNSYICNRHDKKIKWIMDY